MLGISLNGNSDSKKNNTFQNISILVNNKDTKYKVCSKRNVSFGGKDIIHKTKNICEGFLYDLLNMVCSKLV